MERCHSLLQDRQDTDEEGGLHETIGRDGATRSWHGHAPSQEVAMTQHCHYQGGVWAPGCQSFSFSREARKLDFLCEISRSVYIGSKMFITSCRPRSMSAGWIWPTCHTGFLFQPADESVLVILDSSISWINVP